MNIHVLTSSHTTTTQHGAIQVGITYVVLGISVGVVARNGVCGTILADGNILMIIVRTSPLQSVKLLV